MSADRIFLDANILVYAHDKSGGDRHTRAREMIISFWSAPSYPKLSVQVLQETHVTLIRRGIDMETSAELVRSYLAWDVIENRTSVFRQALDLQTQHQLSFWDASILAAALASGATELWSEDFQHGRDYDGIVARNPFLEA